MGDDIYNWAGERGDAWYESLSTFEGMLAPINAPLIDAAHVEGPVVRIADVGCGGGSTTRALFARAAPGSMVHGFDISQTLVDAARSQTDRPEPEFYVCDVESEAPPGEHYDRLVSRFGVMFYQDDAAAFANLRTWLRPGGRCAFAVWGPSDDNVWATVVRDVVAQYVPLEPPEPTAPGPFRYADGSLLADLLAQAGFARVEVRDWRGGLPIGGGVPAGDAARIALASFSTFRKALLQGGEAAFRAAERLLAERLAPYEHDGRVWCHARVHMVTAEASA